MDRGLAGLAELAVFVVLGLTIHLSAITTREWIDGAVLMAVLAAVIRPAAVWVTLRGARLSDGEKGFIAFSGLKGAVPILLAAFALIARVAGARHLYDVTFVAVLVSVVGQGAFVAPVAARLGVAMRAGDRLPWELSVRLGQDPTGAQEYRVSAESRAVGTMLAELPLGEGSWVTLLIRDGDALPPDPTVRLRAGDRLLILAETDDQGDELHDAFASR